MASKAEVQDNGCSLHVASLRKIVQGIYQNAAEIAVHLSSIMVLVLL